MPCITFTSRIRSQFTDSSDSKVINEWSYALSVVPLMAVDADKLLHSKGI